MARGDNTAEMKFRLPHELHTRLEEAASKNAHSASEEVRRRLEASFEVAPSAIDTKTGDLLEAIRFVAQAISKKSGDLGAWYEDIEVFEVFKAAVSTLFDAFRPVGDPPLAKRSARGGAFLAGMALGALEERGLEPIAVLRTRLGQEEEDGQ